MEAKWIQGHEGGRAVTDHEYEIYARVKGQGEYELWEAGMPYRNLLRVLEYITESYVNELEVEGHELEFEVVEVTRKVIRKQ